MRDIVRDQQCARLVDGDADRPPARLVLVVHESRYEIFGLAAWLSVPERHEDDLVAIELLSIPASVLADERAAAILLRKLVGAVERHPERRDVRAQRIVGRDRLFDKVRTLRLHAW